MSSPDKKENILIKQNETIMSIFLIVCVLDGVMKRFPRDCIANIDRVGGVSYIYK